MDVLIVDDDESTLALLKIELSRVGCRVMTVSNSTQALRALRKSPFDWLVVDGQLYPIDGFELASRGKKIQPGLKIVMISGIYELSDIAGYPIRHFFGKPVDTDALSSYMRGSPS